MEQEKNQSHLWSIIIVAIVMGAYVLSGLFSGPAVMNAGMIYRANSGVVLECVLDWNASGLETLLNTAKNKGVSISFFASCAWMEENPEMLSRISRENNSVNLLLTGAPAAFETQIQKGKALLGETLRFVTVDDMDERDELNALAEQYDLEAVFCTFALKNSTIDPTMLVKRVEEEAFDGAIIRFDPAKTTVEAFSQIVDTLKGKGYSIVDITDTK